MLVSNSENWVTSVPLEFWKVTMSKKRKLDPVIRPRNAGSLEVFDMMKYRVEYLQEKRRSGELPPLAPRTATGRFLERWPDLKINIQTVLLAIAVFPFAVLLSPIALFIIGKEEIFDRRIRARSVLRQWMRMISGEDFSEPLPEISSLKKKWTRDFCIRTLWNSHRSRVLSLADQEDKPDHIAELVMLILADDAEKKIRNGDKSRIKLSQKDRYALSVSAVRATVLNGKAIPTELVFDCLSSPLITPEIFMEIAEHYLEAVPENLWKTGLLFNLFSDALIRQNETDLVLLNLALLNKIPNAEGFQKGARDQPPNIQEHLRMCQKSKAECIERARLISSSHRRLKCIEYRTSKYFGLLFIGPKGTDYHDLTANGVNSEKINELLRRTHGLFSVAPLAIAKPKKFNSGSNMIDSDFFYSFLHHQFQNEIEEDALRLTDQSMSELLTEISSLIADPIARAEIDLCDAPSTGFVDFGCDHPFSFLPIDTAQIFSIENGYPNRLPVSLDHTRHKLSKIPTYNKKVDAKILVIGDPSGSLDYSQLEIELISEFFNASDILQLELEDAIQYTKRDRFVPDIDLLHFIGHHKFSYNQGVVSTIPEKKGDVNQNEFLRVFSKFRPKLSYLSACSTNSTLFTDPSSREDALSRRILNLYPSNVISTLWPIPDEAAAYFAREFYRNLGAFDGDPGIALWVTKRSFARGEVAFSPASFGHAARLGGHSNEQKKMAKSPMHWGAYILN